MIKKPPISGFPWHPKTLGEKILRRRLELGFTQLEVANQIGLNDQTISRWETGESIPNIKHYPSIISFLDYYPFEIDNTIRGKIKLYRFTHGLNQKKFAHFLKVPVKEIQVIEKNEVDPTIDLERKLTELFDSKEDSV